MDQRGRRPPVRESRHVVEQERSGVMDTLPYRATVFLRPAEPPCGQIELMERLFAGEADAVCWCRVMIQADPRATGAWMVVKARRGRVLELARESGLLAAGHAPGAIDPAPEPATADVLDGVLLGGAASEVELGVARARMDLMAGA